MGLLNTYKVAVSGYVNVEASSAQDALQAVEDKLARIDHDLTLTTGDVFRTTNFR